MSQPYTQISDVNNTNGCMALVDRWLTFQTHYQDNSQHFSQHTTR